jgi:mannosyltransferase
MATAMAVVLLFHLVSGLYDAPTAAVAAAIYACYPLVTFYATDARPYALVTVTVLISVLVLRRAMCSGSTLRYAACVCLAIYLQFFPLYAVLAQGVLAHPHSQTRRWAVAVSAAVAASAPLLWVAHSQTAEIGWIPQPSMRSITSFVGLLGGGTGLLAVATVTAGAVLIWVRPARLSGTTRFLLVWAVSGPVLLVVGDFVRPDAVARYALVCVAPAVTLLARAIRRLPAASARRRSLLLWCPHSAAQ